uniref:Receptor activity-modifying protein 3 n=1 Tax=Chlorocebus sabaeus TaxID=60711 RepID=A0A0D9RT79_CHLSB
GGCPRAGGCNETGLLERLPLCGKAFADMMGKLDVWKWCNLSEFIVYYESFTNCTEMEANIVGCYWPNPLAQGFITGIHRQFFSNCTMDKVHLEDPPDEVLIPLIIIPVVLTVAMAGGGVAQQAHRHAAVRVWVRWSGSHLASWKKVPWGWEDGGTTNLQLLWPHPTWSWADPSLPGLTCSLEASLLPGRGSGYPPKLFAHS